MKATEVKTGQTYRVKVGQNSTEVKITRVNPKGGWEAVNVRTGKAMNVKSADRIISPSNGSKPDAKNKGKAGKSAASAKQSNTGEPRGRMSGLDAAARVLAESKEPLNKRRITELMFEQKLWQSEGATPDATIYSAIVREIKEKGPNARFKKTGRGKFVFNG